MIYSSVETKNGIPYLTVNGKEIASTAVSEEEAMLTFRAEAGSVSIERRI